MACRRSRVRVPVAPPTPPVCEPPRLAPGGKLQAVTGPSVILTNTSGNIGDQQGWFTNAGVSGHYVGGGSGEFQWGTGRCGQFVGNLEVGIGAGIGGEAAVGKSYTGVVWTSKPDQPCPK